MNLSVTLSGDSPKSLAAALRVWADHLAPAENIAVDPPTPPPAPKAAKTKTKKVEEETFDDDLGLGNDDDETPEPPMALTLKEVQEALRAFGATRDTGRMKTVLAKFNIKSVSQLKQFPESKYQALVDALAKVPVKK